MSNETENRSEIKTVLDLLEHESKSFHTFIHDAYVAAREKLSEGNSNVTAGEVVKMTHRGIRNTAVTFIFNKAAFSTFILGAIAQEVLLNISDDERAELATIELKEIGYEVE